MFWIDVASTIIGGLICIPFIRDWIQHLACREIDQLLFDRIRATLVIVDAAMSVAGYLERQHEVAVLRDYGYVSTLNRLASRGPVREQMLDIGGFYLAFQGVFSVDNSKGRLCSCDADIMNKINDVINMVPNFPFSYYAKAGCLQKSGDEGWR
jgi:hypothetical protein